MHHLTLVILKIVECLKKYIFFFFGIKINIKRIFNEKRRSLIILFLFYNISAPGITNINVHIIQ